MITPACISVGDRVAIIATARKIIPEEIAIAIKIFKDWGLNVVLGKNIFNEYNQFAGTDEERAADLQSMIDDDSIKAIFCARGGYGTVRLLEKVDFTALERKPKWMVGYSDITALHAHLNAMGIETIHATMPLNFNEEGIAPDTLSSLKTALFDGKISYTFSTDSFSRRGSAEGIFVGGNLSVLYSLSGSVSDINTDGKILFLEDLDEYLYHIDRMIINLKRAGKLNNLAGLIVGGMSDMNDNQVPFGKTAYEIIMEAVDKYEYPKVFGFPAGHIKDNRALIMGRKARLSVNDTTELAFV